MSYYYGLNLKTEDFLFVEPASHCSQPTANLQPGLILLIILPFLYLFILNKREITIQHVSSLPGLAR